MSDDKAAVQPESEESLSDNQAETPQQTDPKKVADDPSVDEATDTGQGGNAAADLEADLVAENIEAASAENTIEPEGELAGLQAQLEVCLLYTSPSPRDRG